MTTVCSAVQIKRMIDEAAKATEIRERSKRIAQIWRYIDKLPHGKVRERVSALCRQAAMKDFARSA